MTIDIVRAVHYTNGREWNFPLHHHPYNSLYFVLDGDGHVEIDGVLTNLFPGRLYLIPTDTPFACWCDSHIEKIYIDVSAPIVPGYDVFFNQHACRSIPYPLDKIRAMTTLLKHPSVKNNLYVQAETERVIADFMDEDFLQIDPGILAFKPLLDDISRNLSADLQVSRLAERFRENPTVLSRRFKSKFGQPLKSYMQKLLLDKIKQELITTDKSLKELAAEYNFCDQYYLSGFFKRQVGFSPRDYRKQMNAGSR